MSYISRHQNKDQWLLNTHGNGEKKKSGGGNCNYRKKTDGNEHEMKVKYLLQWY